MSLVNRRSPQIERVAPISSERAQREIERVVREQLLFGSERELPVDLPLGELGLDSLALLHLIMAIEEAFGVQLPDNVLVRRDPISIRALGDLVVVATRRTQPGSVAVPPADPTILPPHFRMERLHRWLARRGWLGRHMRTAATMAWHAKRFLFEHSAHYVMERPLEGKQPTIGPPPGIDLRPFTRADQDLMAGLWPDFDDRRARREMQRWLADGAIALVAVEGSRVVALDLLSLDGNRGEVELAPARGACWGLQLVEAPDVRGRGIGLALLAYSLRVSRDRGFRAQLATVRSDNAPMIAAGTQILGFRAIGRAGRTRIFGITRWSWEVEGLRGRGRLLSI